MRILSRDSHHVVAATICCVVVVLATNAQLAADDKEAVAQSEIDQQQNPYAPPAGLSVNELAEYIQKLQEKPKSVRQRAGFALGIVAAAEQILAADASQQLQMLAIDAKFGALHEAATGGDVDSDELLSQLASKLKDDPRDKVQQHVRFVTLERRAIEADKLELEDIPALLVELKEYFEKEALGAKHLRMASSTIRAVNRLEDDDARESHFQTFGGLFAKSKDRQLAAYGRRLSKTDG